ncbi:helix-turn-helix domain-containing protein [Desulfosporosinus sp. FKB]|uniref:winged helix-turn-helix domain-containing protein n=1 Tax=Desulfosporosinus sp. FKB TaxID=1969835 RepID=UPI000B49B1A5|nr:helix-turn-helix domain-containing protein [Desulfosporosinus sp. FKB]
MNIKQDIIPLCENCYLDPSMDILIKNNINVPLSRIQCRLLYFLTLNIGKPVSTEALVNYVWGSEKYIERQELYVYINRLRNILEDNPKYPKRLLSLRSFGYILFPG